jgi:hypothetical protein
MEVSYSYHICNIHCGTFQNIYNSEKYVVPWFMHAFEVELNETINYFKFLVYYHQRKQSSCDIIKESMHICSK